jgi:hypothetical protein
MPTIALISTKWSATACLLFGGGCADHFEDLLGMVSFGNKFLWSGSAQRETSQIERSRKMVGQQFSLISTGLQPGDIRRREFFNRFSGFPSVINR